MGIEYVDKVKNRWYWRLAELNTEAKNHTFSALVGVGYHPATSEPENVELISPVR